MTTKFHNKLRQETGLHISPAIFHASEVVHRPFPCGGSQAMRDDSTTQTLRQGLLSLSLWRIVGAFSMVPVDAKVHTKPPQTKKNE